MENYKKSEQIEWVSGKVKGFAGRDLINLDNGGLKMVKVDPFAIYPSHLHPEKTEYIFVLEGSPQIEIGEETYTGENGDFFILPNAIQHSIKNSTDLDCILLVGSIKN